MTDPFKAQSVTGNSGYDIANLDFSNMANWALPPIDVLQRQYLNQQIANLKAMPDQQAALTAALEKANQPQSPWVTGTQAFGNVAQGLSGLASIWLGLKGLKQQKEVFNFNKEMANTNMDNSIRDYNRRLSDTLANRALNNGQGQGWVSQQLAQYSAKRS